MTLKVPNILEGLKLPKFFVRYTDDHGDSNEQCSKCRFYGRRSCEKVAGDISPSGWCQLFQRG